MRKKTYPHNIKNLVKLTIYLSLLITLQACGEEGGGVSVSESTGSGSSGGSATLTWTAPTTTMDESALTGTNIITGYKVCYGTASGNYTTSVDVGNVTTYTVTGLSGGTTYYFAVTASNSSGESGYSNEVSKTIQ